MKGARLTPPARMTDAQRRVHDAIASGPRGAVVGPLGVWLNSPGLAERAQALGQFARYDSALPLVQSELAILVTARIWSSGFEWSHHAPIALEAGLPEAAVAAIGRAERAGFDDPALAAIFGFVVELQRDRTVTDATYRAAEAALGQVALVDLVGICGYYGLISMTINAFAVPQGEGPALPDLDVPAEQMFR